MNRQGGGEGPTATAGPLDAAALLDRALDHHRAGRFREAMALYARVLARDPGHADALHLSGLAAHQTGDSGAGLERIRAALAVRSDFPAAHNSLGSLLADLGRNAEAAEAFATAIAQQGDYVQAHGNLGTVLEALGRLAEAESSYERALRFDPRHVGTRFNLALLHRWRGRIDLAAHGFHEVVKSDPGHAGAWRHLGLCLRGLRHPDAEACLRRALADAPGDADLSRELGTLLTERGCYADAQAVLEPAVAAVPDDALLRFALGSALYGQGRLEAAVLCYRDALARAPGLPGVCNNLGVALLDLGDHGAALPVLRRATLLDPGDALVLNNLGTALDGQRRFDEAMAVYTRALRLRPDYGKALNNLGGVWKAWKRSDRAADLRCRAIAAQPEQAEAYANLASIFQDRDDLATAERLFRRALRLDPRNAAALTGLGLVLQVQGRTDEAEAAHRAALSIDDRNAEAHANLGMLLWQAHADATAAETSLSHAIALDPALGPARLNRGIVRLTRGDLAAGWDDYQWRFRAKGYDDRPIAAPLWEGGNGHRLLVWREQGVGDEILFSSCWADVIRRVGHLVIECDRRLVPLFARSFPQATVRAETLDAEGRETIDPPDVDAQSPAGAVPRLLRDRLTGFEVPGPWLVPDPALVAAWRERLAALGPGLRVGIGWRSQLMTTERRAAYTALDQWGAIFAVPGIIVVNLQYGDCTAELEAAEARFGVRIHRWADLDLKDDFDGAAALVANLDLVISPAMSAGELAGALGVPVWRFGARDWTQLGTAVRPWFPSMRLFQPGPGETLEDALARMAGALLALRPAPAPATARTPIPNDAGERTAEAVALYRQGDATSAERLVRSVLERAPGHAVALHLAAVLAARRGDAGEAAQLYGLAARADPGNAAAHAGQAESLQRLGRRKEADDAQRRAIAAGPDAAEHWINRTALLRALGRDGEARRTVARAIRLRPDLAVAHTHASQLAGDPLLALGCHRRAVALIPGAAESLSNLGGAFHALDRFTEAERVLGWALRSTPDMAVAWTNRGNALDALGRGAEAEVCHRAAIAQRPDLAEAHANLGFLRHRAGRRDEALDAYRHALAAEPKHAQAQYNRSLILLEAGALRAGWGGHEWRFGTPQFRGQRRRLAARAWRGENIAASRLLVWREQGVGDEILFASCYGEAMKRAGHLVIECDRRLVPLFTRSFPGATVRGETVEPRDVDVQIAAGSLPRLLRPDLKRFPARPSWLVPDPARVAAWRERLAALGPGLKIGIGWRSQLMTAQRRDAYTALDQWGAIVAVPGITLVNLQYGDCAAELEAAEARFGVRIHRWADLDLKDDFDGAAALVANLDLVISPAMSAGELAGALGVPVWRFGARDWTQLGSGVRPWFPSMRLFQPRPGETLEDALGAIARALRAGIRPLPAPADKDPDALLDRAADAHRAGRRDEAAALYERVLARRPTDPVALHLSGLLVHQSGQPARGEPRIAAALAALPGYATAHVSLGSVRLALGRPAEAAASFRIALALQPGDAAALSNLGNALDAIDAPERAERAQRRAVHAAPALAEAHDNHGAVLARLGRLAEAEAAHRQALARAPGLVSAWMNRSVALRRLGRLDAADRSGRIALALDPAMADAMANRGRLLRERGEPDSALLWCDRALAVDPDAPEAAFNGAVLRLARGGLRAGWEGYDRRFDTRELGGAARRPGVPAWTGGRLDGRRILVWREQGIGDEMMFAACLPELIARAGHVVVECDRRLIPLYARSFPQATVRPAPGRPDAPAGMGPAGAGIDGHVAAGSLPRHLRPSLATFTSPDAGSGHLRADPGAVAVWRERVATLGPGLAVGVAWRSGQLDPDRLPDYTRLEDWGPVFAVPGIVPVNLQYGDCAEELAAARRRFGTAPHAFADLDLKDDLDGAAALMAALDLVIAPATSTGELAGALGVPVWRLGRSGDWTALGTAVRPWFGSMRVFATENGETVADQLPKVAAALRRLARTAAVPEGRR